MLNEFLSFSCWKKYKEYLDTTVKFIGNRKPVLYGYQGQGYFLKWFLDKYSKEYDWTVVDDRDYIFDCNVVKPIEISLGLINISNTVVLVTKEKSSKIMEQIHLMGYDLENSDNVLHIPSLFQAEVPFFSWIESTEKVDILKGKTLYNSNSPLKNYSPISERAVVNIEEYLPKNISILDVGAGKGAAAIYFASCGRKVGLVEYDLRLFQISKNNFEKLGLKAEWYLGDASSLNSELDNWDGFCMYNPFVGEIFFKFVTELKLSLKRNPRKIYIAYGNPMEAKYLLQSGFVLETRILTDCSCRYWLIFTNNI